jgi:ABC-type dipeptide/oligopeptide/nickel transport system permease component
MGRYVARRLGLMVVAAIGVTLISFVISHAVPADPIVSNLGQQASQRPEIVQAFKQKWGLDKPLHVQYVAFLANLMRGELGIDQYATRDQQGSVRQVSRAARRDACREAPSMRRRMPGRQPVNPSEPSDGRPPPD